MSQYGRLIRIEFSLKSEVITRFHVDQSMMHISFTVDKTDTTENNQAQVTLWNINPSKTAMLMSSDNVTVTILAGYQGSGGLTAIFTGDMIALDNPREGADRATKITLATGANLNKEGERSLSWRGNVRLDQVIRQILAGSGIVIEEPLNAPAAPWRRGLHLTGSRIDMLKKVCAGKGYRYTIDDNVFKIYSLKDEKSSVYYIPELSPTSGLLDSPQYMTKQEKAKASDEVPQLPTGSGDTLPVTTGVENSTRVIKGYSCESLFSPLIYPRGQVKLTSREVNGIFNVKQVHHSCSSYSEEFYTSFEVELWDLQN